MFGAPDFDSDDDNNDCDDDRYNHIHTSTHVIVMCQHVSCDHHYYHMCVCNNMYHAIIITITCVYVITCIMQSPSLSHVCM